MAAADYRLMTEATGQRIAAALESLVNLGDPVTIAHGGTGASTAAAALAALGGVAVTDIVDDLTSTATDKPLSAAQGKALNDKTKEIHFGTTTATTTANGNITINLNENNTIIGAKATNNVNYVILPFLNYGQWAFNVRTGDAQLSVVSSTSVTINYAYI